MVDCIIVIGVLKHSALFHSLCDLKAILINVQCSLIQELILNKSELGYNAMEAMKIICCVKAKGTITHSIVIRWLKKFCSG